ncbi:MAG TPA: hypothetical protein VFN97_18045 [Actinospica sp.]|nr:hypothetical protein [Actinospica sp.]
MVPERATLYPSAVAVWPGDAVAEVDLVPPGADESAAVADAVPPSAEECALE